MSRRFLSFLTDIEQALHASDPSPRQGAWQNARTVNFQSGLARLLLATRGERAGVDPLGAVLLQSFTLADGTLCLKAFLSWAGTPAETVQAVYAQPDTDWQAEAGRVAQAWLSGLAAAAKSSRTETAEPLAVAV